MIINLPIKIISVKNKIKFWFRIGNWISHFWISNSFLSLFRPLNMCFTYTWYKTEPWSTVVDLGLPPWTTVNHKSIFNNQYLITFWMCHLKLDYNPYHILWNISLYSFFLQSLISQSLFIQSLFIQSPSPKMKGFGYFGRFLSAESESVRTGVQCASIPFALPNRHI